MESYIPECVGNEKNVYSKQFFSDFYDIEKNVTEYYGNDINKSVEENVREHYVNNSVDQDIELSDDLTEQDWKNWKIAQQKMTEMYREFERICKKHKIKYFAVGGTLLGVIRHKGWIPYDGDIDLGILEEDYNKLKEIIQKELPDTMWFQNKENDPLYKSDIAKIRDLNSCYDNEKRSWEWHSGLQIDLFIIERIENDKLYNSKLKLFRQDDNKLPSYDDVFPLLNMKFEGIDMYVPKNYKHYFKVAFKSENPGLIPKKDRKPHEGGGKVNPTKACSWFTQHYPQLYSNSKESES